MADIAAADFSGPAGSTAARRGLRRSVSAAIALTLVWFALLYLFYRYPQIDIAASGAFYDVPADCGASPLQSAACARFAYAAQPLFMAMRRIFFYLPTAAALVLVAMLAAALQHHGATFRADLARRITLLLVSLLVGPYLIVNGLLKEYSGRPRPYQTDLFGGNLPFVPAGSFSGRCDGNCSFVSGEAAGAGWLVCLVILVPPRYRLAVLPPLIVAALVTPALRLSFGGHYLSDTVLGFLIGPIATVAVFAVADMRRAKKNAAVSARN